MKNFVTCAAIVGASFLASQAVATSYTHSSPPVNGIYEANYFFDSATDQFKLDFQVNAPTPIDGFWFVINNGPQPYFSNSGEYAIIYSDLNDIWAYQYATSSAGVGGVNTAFNSPLLEKFTGAVSTSVNATKTTYSMDLDLATLNNLTGIDPNWIGVAFDTMIGTWLHGTSNTFANCPTDVSGAPIYQNGDDLTCFAGNQWNGWDEKLQFTTVVPLPAAGMFLVAGVGSLMVAGRKRRNRKS